MASTKDIILYIKTACKNNKKLAHGKDERNTFFRFNINEIMENIRTGIDYPALGLENIEGNLIDFKADDVRNSVTVSFVVIKPVDMLDFNGQEDVMDECYKIGMEVFSKMHKDAHIRGTIIQALQLQNARYIAVGPIFNNHFGYRFSVDINFSAMSEVYFKPADWNDETDYNN